MTLTTPSTLTSVLAAAKPNDTLKLVGTFGVQRKWAKVPLTLDCTEATISGWYLSHIVGLTINGGLFVGAAPLKVDDAVGLRIVGAAFVGPESPQNGKPADGTGLDVNGGSGVSVEGSSFTGFKAGVSLAGVSGVSVVDNVFARMRSDGADFGGCQHGQVLRNKFFGSLAVTDEHPDGIQLWSRPGKITSDFLIQGNEILGASQGIHCGNHEHDGIDDGGYDRVTIEGNDIYVNRPNGITLMAGRKCSVTNNRLRTIAGAEHQAKITTEGDVTRSGNRVAAYRDKPAVAD